MGSRLALNYSLCLIIGLHIYAHYFILKETRKEVTKWLQELCGTTGYIVIVAIVKYKWVSDGIGMME